MSKGRNTAVVSVRLDNSMKWWLDEEAERKGKTVNDILKEFIAWYISKLEEKRNPKK